MLYGGDSPKFIEKNKGNRNEVLPLGKSLEHLQHSDESDSSGSPVSIDSRIEYQFQSQQLNPRQNIKKHQNQFSKTRRSRNFTKGEIIKTINSLENDSNEGNKRLAELNHINLVVQNTESGDELKNMTTSAPFPLPIQNQGKMRGRTTISGRPTIFHKHVMSNQKTKKMKAIINAQVTQNSYQISS